MADYNNKIRELQTLDPYEALGKSLYQQENGYKKRSIEFSPCFSHSKFNPLENRYHVYIIVRLSSFINSL